MISGDGDGDNGVYCPLCSGSGDDNDNDGVYCPLCSGSDGDDNDNDGVYFPVSQMVVEAASGAAVYAALHCLEEVTPSPQKVGVILCGGNVDLDRLPWEVQATRN